MSDAKVSFYPIGVPPSRTLTINGTTYDLSVNRSWSVGDVFTSGSYSNPTWITSLAWSKITSTPTTLAGYGITDGVSTSRTLTINGTAFDLSANRTWSVGTVTSVAALTLGTSGTDLSSTVATGTTTPVITLNVPTASATNRGALSSADWSTFNNKIGGSGTNGQISYFTAASTIASSSTLTFTPTTALRLSNSVTAGLGLAQGSFFSPTVIAAANNDVLVGLDITPTFTVGVFTGVTPLALRASGRVTFQGSVTNTGNLSNYTVTASSALARSKAITSTLVAAANNDVLAALDIAPTFTNGLFTGVSNFALRTQTGNVVFGTTSGSVGIGTSSINASAILDITSTARGFLAPRMTTAQKNAIGTPATGLLVYDTTLNAFNFYNGSVWGGLGGGLTNWTEAYSAAQPTSSFTATNASANVNAALVPKGTGAVVASIPDGGGGGNSRGIYAVDLQTRRNNAAQVASGDYSVIGGGFFNRATAFGSHTGGGYNNNNASTYGLIGGGETNTIVGGQGDVITGGSNNTINFAGVGNANWRFIGGGYGNSTSGGQNDTAAIVGGLSNYIGLFGNYAFLGAGRQNSCTGTYSALTGGYLNRIGNGDNNLATNCFLGAGQSNVIDTNSDYSTLGGGLSNTISGVDYCFIGGGNTNTISQNYGTIVGGQSQTISATYGYIGGGQSNTVSASYASINGGLQATAGLYGQQARAAGQFAASGDAQAHELIWRRSITGTAQTELFLDGASVAAILPGTNAIWQGIIDIAAVCTVTGNGTTTVGDVAATSYKVTIKRIGTTTSLVGTVQEIGTTNSNTSMSTSVFTIDNNDTSESLRIQFTPPTTAGSTTVTRAVATFRGLQIQY